jgi:phosphatidylserine decarboxylase
MLQISIFMSVWDVHINWYPVSGKIVSTRHYPGKYLVARVPKSSELNEQHITLIEKEKDEIILVKQIAGAVARRILNYSQNAGQAQAGEEMGFIRFGSRVDVLLPETCIPTVKPGQRVKGQQNVIAVLK